jgi:hypothetical protein
MQRLFAQPPDNIASPPTNTSASGHVITAAINAISGEEHANSCQNHITISLFLTRVRGGEE